MAAYIASEVIILTTVSDDFRFGLPGPRSTKQQLDDSGGEENGKSRHAAKHSPTQRAKAEPLAKGRPTSHHGRRKKKRADLIARVKRLL